MPCLRLIDRAGVSLETQKGQERVAKYALGTLGGKRPPGSVDPLLANCLEGCCTAYVMLLVWLLLPGWRIVLCSCVRLLAAVHPGPARAGKRKSLGRPLRRSQPGGREGVKPMGCGLSVRLSIHGICAARKKVMLWVRKKERGSIAFNLENHYRTHAPVNPSKYS